MNFDYFVFAHPVIACTLDEASVILLAYCTASGLDEFQWIGT